METIDKVKQFNIAFDVKMSEKPGLDECSQYVEWKLKEQAAVLNEIAKTFHLLAQYKGDTNKAFLRMQLMTEELSEVCQAMANNDIKNLAQELADLRYVCDGTVLVYGLANCFEKVFNEVHRANMSKLDENGKPVKNAAGRVVKSNLFKPVNMDGLVC